MGLHQKARLTESFYGKLSTDLLAAVDRQIIIYRATIPLNTVRHLLVLLPRKAEFEPGFAHCMDRIAMLAHRIGRDMDVYSGKETLTALQTYRSRRERSINVGYREYVSWTDFLPLAHDSRPDDLVIFVCARRGTISHHSYMDRLPDQIERYFSARSIMLLYPHQPAAEALSTSTIRSGVPLKVR